MTMSVEENNHMLRDKLVSCLTQQLSEIDLLKSMYPNRDEIVITDNQVIDEIKKVINCESEYTSRHLDIAINLIIDDLKLEVCIDLPSLYPEEEPDVYIRCNQLNRQQETNLNTSISNYLKSNNTGEVCLYSAISWLQDNIYSFRKTSENDNKTKENSEDSSEIEDKFVRLWIYSHHIYNKKKREEIIKWAKDLNITGFCLPGKPGIICIEGSDSVCKHWWRNIKSLSWKKIVIRKSEIFESSEQNQKQKFFKFEEIHFQNPSVRHKKHADLSGFFKFMENQGFTEEFNEFFGLSSDI